MSPSPDPQTGKVSNLVRYPIIERSTSNCVRILRCFSSVVAKFPGNFKSAVKKDNTLGQPNPVTKFGKKGHDEAVQKCCPFFGDPKVTF